MSVASIKGRKWPGRKKNPGAAMTSRIGLPGIQPELMPNVATRSSRACLIFLPPDMMLDSPLGTLRRFAAPRNKGREAVSDESCDFCSTTLAPQHRHLLETANRKLICVCDACALRFENVQGGRFKLIPRDSCSLPDFQITDTEWDSLAFQIGLVFIFLDSLNARPMAIYPSPAGAMESLLPLENWQTIVAANSQLAELKPDVQALLINRVRQSRDYFIVPIDICFELTGLVRKHWRGLSGGEKVWEEIRGFFDRLRVKTLRPALRQRSA